MSVPIRHDELEALETAREVAHSCVARYSSVLNEVHSPDDTTPYRLSRAILTLIDTLNWGWGAIPEVEEVLILVSSGPLSAGGLTCASACGLAWELAVSLWRTIRRVDARLDPRFSIREPGAPEKSSGLRYRYRHRIDEDGLRELSVPLATSGVGYQYRSSIGEDDPGNRGLFGLHGKLFRELEEKFRTTLIQKPVIDSDWLNVQIQIVRARDHILVRREAPLVDPDNDREPKRGKPKGLSLTDRILLVKPRASSQARLAEFMEPREGATTADIEDFVYGDNYKQTSDALKKLVDDTNNTLEELTYDRRLKYTVLRVFWRPIGDVAR
jgi:hypothetical protein